MIVLGINGGFRQGYQDVSAVLVKDGEVLAAIEEERLSRIKFSAGRLPYLSVKAVLQQAGLSYNQINTIAFHGSTWGDEIQPRLESYFTQHFGHCPPLVRYHHHNCHAASTYYASGFDNSLIITIDGSGDGVSVQVSTGIQGQLNVVQRFERPHSFGLFYSLITQYCGFTKESDEYKLMGLSSYGNRKAFDFKWLFDFKDGDLRLNTDYMVEIQPRQPSPHRDEMLFNDAFIQKMGRERRIPGSPTEPFYMDVAASAQQRFEEVMLDLAAYYVQLTGLKKICLAGGSALNCVMNQQLMNCGLADALYILPASNDAGISLGAAWLACVEAQIKPKPLSHTYLGNSYTDNEIEAILKACHISYSKPVDIAEDAASAIAANQVIGWFHGRMEFGPRALGNRSILANATNPQMQDIVNRKIKLRESFRPFCPSVLANDCTTYFKGKQTVSPYMTITYQCEESVQSKIPAVVHTDGTARIQTVHGQENPLYFSLLQKLKEKTGHGVVLNTSFNLSHEPIVCTPRDALATFFSSGLDVLYIGSYKISK